MAISRTKTFRSGNSEAVRLPKDIAFGPDVDLIVVRSGDVVTLYPARKTLAEMIEQLEAMPKPPAIEKREVSELDERPGM